MENDDFKRDANGLLEIDTSTDHIAIWKVCSKYFQ